MYEIAASSVALVQSTGIEPITKTFPRKEAPAKSFGLAILIAPSELQTQESRLNLDGVCARGIVGVVRRHLADLRGRGILQSLGQRDLLTATRATVAALGRTCNRPVVPIDLPLLSGLSASARSPVAWVRCADSHWGCRVMLLLLCLYLSHLSTSRANPAHVFGYNLIHRHPCRVRAHAWHRLW